MVCSETTQAAADAALPFYCGNWDSVVMDPNGGLVFSIKVGGRVTDIHVWDDGSVDEIQFEGTKIVSRKVIAEASQRC